jgi:type III secretory pathway component EscU
MSILNINLDLEENYINLIKDLYKVIVILIIFQILIYYSNSQKNIINTALMGTILNDDFMTLLIYIIIGICGYYLVFDKIISIN